MTFEEFKNLMPGDQVIYREDHATVELRGLQGTITSFYGITAEVQTKLGALFTTWTGDGNCCFDFPK